MISEHQLLQGTQSKTLAVQHFAEQPFIFDARGVLYAPAQDALIVSDLHLEKGSYLASWGNPLRVLDSRATLTKLGEIVSEYQPTKVICLGDSFHDLHSLSRMQATDLELLLMLINNVEQWVWVVGNHDSEIDPSLPGKVVDSEVIAGISLFHEPMTNAAPQPISQIVGHYHPKVSHKIRRTPYKGKCFVWNNNTLIMPAFGQYTGGLYINDEALLAVLPKSTRRCLLLYDGAIYDIGKA